MNTKYRHLVISGASGHVGNNVCRLAHAQGYKVRALAHTPEHMEMGLGGLAVEKMLGDINDSSYLNKALKGADALLHLAAVISIDGDKEGKTDRVNYQGTRKIYAAAKAAGVKRVIYVSSIHAVDHDETSPVVDESSPLAVDHPIAYNRSKARTQAWLESENDSSAVTVNPTGIIGPNDFIPSQSGELLLKLMNNKMPAVLNAGFNWVDVRDVAEGILSVMEQGKQNRYLLSGHYGTIKEISRMVGEVLGKKTVQRTAPMWAAKLSAPFAKALAGITKTPPQLTSESLFHLEHCGKNISHDRAAGDFGYSPRPLIQTIGDTVQWFLDNNSQV